MGTRHSHQILLLAVVSRLNAHVPQDFGLYLACHHPYIPCHGWCWVHFVLDWELNELRRLEADNFTCFSDLHMLDVGYAFPDSKVHGANMGPTWGRQDPGRPHVGPINLLSRFITYIAPGAFDRLLSLIDLRLRGNRGPAELPPNLGPNSVNMKYLYMKHMDIQMIPPNSYWAQMSNILAYETSIYFYNDFFNGWNSLKTLFSLGSVAPNLTDRAPNIVHLNMWTNGVNIPNENIYNLKSL